MLVECGAVLYGVDGQVPEVLAGVRLRGGHVVIVWERVSRLAVFADHVEEELVDADVVA